MNCKRTRLMRENERKETVIYPPYTYTVTKHHPTSYHHYASILFHCAHIHLDQFNNAVDGCR